MGEKETDCYAPNGGAVGGGRLSGTSGLGGRLGGVTAIENACCQYHGFISPSIQEVEEGGPYCPRCHKKIVAINDCPVHGQILFKDIKWIDNKPYCPNCANSSLLKTRNTTTSPSGSVILCSEPFWIRLMVY